MSDAHDLRELEKDPRLFLYTSLTAGSSHIITATSRLETILKANKVPFQAIDVATDEKARRLWQRRAGKRKLPGLVKDGFVIGDLDEVEEWNEYGELKENIGTVPGATAAVPAPKLPIIPTATAGTTTVKAEPVSDLPKRVALPGAAEIAARNNILPKSSPEDAVKPETMTSAPATKEKSIEKAIRFKGDEKHVEHLSAPASAIPSTSASPDPITSKLEAEKPETEVSAPDDTTAGAEKEIEEAATVNVENDPDTASKPAGDLSWKPEPEPLVPAEDMSKTTKSAETTRPSDSKEVSTTAEDTAGSTESGSADSKAANTATAASELVDRTKSSAIDSQPEATSAEPPELASATMKADTPTNEVPATASSEDATPAKDSTANDTSEPTTSTSDATTVLAPDQKSAPTSTTDAEIEEESADTATQEADNPTSKDVEKEEKPTLTQAVKEKISSVSEAVKESVTSSTVADKTSTSTKSTEDAVPDAKKESVEATPDLDAKLAASSSMAESLPVSTSTTEPTTASKTQKQPAAEPELAEKSVDD